MKIKPLSDSARYSATTRRELVRVLKAQGAASWQRRDSSPENLVDGQQRASSTAVKAEACVFEKSEGLAALNPPQTTGSTPIQRLVNRFYG